MLLGKEFIVELAWQTLTVCKYGWKTMPNDVMMINHMALSNIALGLHYSESSSGTQYRVSLF